MGQIVLYYVLFPLCVCDTVCVCVHVCARVCVLLCFSMVLPFETSKAIVFVDALRFSVATQKKSKTLDGPLKKPRKPQVKLLCNWLTFCEKIQLIQEKIQVFRKSGFSPPKSLMTFSFLVVVNSDFYIFTRKLTKNSETTTRSLLFHQKPLAFQQKLFENIFSGEI